MHLQQPKFKTLGCSHILWTTLFKNFTTHQLSTHCARGTYKYLKPLAILCWRKSEWLVVAPMNSLFCIATQRNQQINFNQWAQQPYGLCLSTGADPIIEKYTDPALERVQARSQFHSETNNHRNRYIVLARCDCSHRQVVISAWQIWNGMG